MNIILIQILQINKFQNQIDSLKLIELEKSRQKIYPFNPNYINDFKGYQLGMNIQEIDKLLDFRKTGKYIHSGAEFQNVTGVSDSLLLVISPYFKFPKWTQSKKENEISSTFKPSNKDFNIVAKDLNTASLKELQTINGIGEKLANRIVAYRKLLQGYSFNEQLYEVYYLDKEVADRVLKKFIVLEIPNISKININNASFKEILSLPYIDYDLTQKIFNYRNENDQFIQIEDLKKIDSFPIEKFDRIALYLTAD
jgi:DNA uptake protein ComE-like DNA-binding protein